MKNVCIVLILASLFSLAAVHAQAPFEAGGTKQLFTDGFLIGDSAGVSFTVNPPLCQGAVLIPEYPWENWTLSYFNVMEDSGLYKMWYGCWEKPAMVRHICYAASPDGINWDKPDLGLVEHGGSFDNNILPVTFEDGGSLFIDPTADAGERYKLTGNNPLPQMYTSADGINFTLFDSVLLDMMPDSHNPMFYDKRLDTYVAYLRSWNYLPDYDDSTIPNRTVSRLVISDPMAYWEYPPVDTHFYKFGPTRPPAISDELDIVMTIDSNDAPDADIYTSGVVQYAENSSVYLAFPSIYYHYPEPPTGAFYNDGILNVQVAVSHDGLGWVRYRTPYIDNTACGDSLRQMYIGLGMIFANDSIYQYLYGVDETHGDSIKTSAYYRFAQRMDGFISLDAATTPGYARTIPMSFTGNALVVNYKTASGGYVLCELQDQMGNPISGFTNEECDTLRGSDISGRVSWSGNPGFEALRGTPVRIRFELLNTKLFAFQFVDDPALGVDDNGDVMPGVFSLNQNYPNPFNPATRIEYTLKKSGEVELVVYNISGQRIRTLVAAHQSPGEHAVEWDGRDEAGQAVASGIYFYQLSVGASHSTRKMMLVK